VIGESATGSGKTLAFACSIVENVSKGHGVQALVLSPTRELTEQIKNEIQKVARHKGLKVVSIYGGVPIDKQLYELQTADVVVATPGRMLDHIDRRTIKLSKIRILVLDEADRMLDMGFIDDVDKIVGYCPMDRQTLFFSATVTQKLKKIADRYMRTPVKVTAKRYVDPTKLKQVYYNVSRNMKLSLLVHLLKNKNGLTMIFCNTRKSTDFVIKNLHANNIHALAIHGGFTQNKRDKALKMFNSRKDSVLVCTDVAARGLHINNVSHVINYEMPNDPKDYVHRIGRTARAGEEGKVINLICEQDHENFSRVEYEYGDFVIRNEKRPYVEMIKPQKSFNKKRLKRKSKRFTSL
jgi:ATP-dependent RNA helicase DeaD